MVCCAARSGVVIGGEIKRGLFGEGKNRLRGLDNRDQGPYEEGKEMDKCSSKLNKGGSYQLRRICKYMDHIRRSCKNYKIKSRTSVSIHSKGMETSNIRPVRRNRQALRVERHVVVRCARDGQLRVCAQQGGV